MRVYSNIVDVVKSMQGCVAAFSHQSPYLLCPSFIKFNPAMRKSILFKVTQSHYAVIKNLSLVFLLRRGK